MTAVDTRPWWQFKPGVSGNPHGPHSKAARLAERVRHLAADYDDPSQQLLKIIARHLDDAERANTVERRAKAANTANRLLRQLKRREAQLRSMPEIMAGVGK